MYFKTTDLAVEPFQGRGSYCRSTYFEGPAFCCRTNYKAMEFAVECVTWPWTSCPIFLANFPVERLKRIWNFLSNELQRHVFCCRRPYNVMDLGLEGIPMPWTFFSKPFQGYGSCSRRTYKDTDLAVEGCRNASKYEYFSVERITRP